MSLLALLSEPIKNRNAYFEKYYSDDVSDDETFEFTSSQTDQCEKDSYCVQLVETITLIVINHRKRFKQKRVKSTRKIAPSTEFEPFQEFQIFQKSQNLIWSNESKT